MGFGLKIDTAYSIVDIALYSFICIISASAHNNDNGQTSGLRSPNIIFILADDLGWDDVGFHGSEIKTPNIDRLAKEGVILNNYYVQPVCTPTRSAILTGRYPINTGLQHYVIVGSQPYGLPLNVSTLPHYLKDLGYKTHAIGKWHLGFCSDAYLPESRGFDSFLGYYTGHSDYLDHYTHDGGFLGYDLHYKKAALWNRSEVYSTEVFTDHATSVIESHDKSLPLFMYVAHQAVHAGNFDTLEAPQKYIDRFDYITNYKRKVFAGMVSALDDSVGAIYQSLVDAEMADNTVIVFSTDNGGPTNGYDGNAACNWPLRGSKGTLWQGGVQGVSFVHSPLLKKKGYINTKMMHASDWTPTLFSAALNVNLEADKPTDALKKIVNGVDGTDQWEVISRDVDTRRRETLLNIDPINKQEAILVGDFKLIHGAMHGGRYDGWYPPPPHRDVPNPSSQDKACPDCSTDEGKTSPNTIFDLEEMDNNNSMEIDKLILLVNKQYEQWKKDSLPQSRQAELSSLYFRSEKDSQNSDTAEIVFDSLSNKTISIDCGPKPPGASTNCNPGKEVCLFNIKDDPCEYMNLAQNLTSVVQLLKERLDVYRRTMVPPINANLPVDPRGNPQKNGGVWQPWL